MSNAMPASASPEPEVPDADARGDADTGRRASRRRQLRVGWTALLFYLVLGAVLEALHGFKVDWYLSVATDARRLMLTLAHAHGTLLALVNLAFAASLDGLPALSSRGRALVSACLTGALFLLPLGFLLGGIFLHGSDPGLGVLLVPVGAMLLFVGVAVLARAAWKSDA